MVCRAASLLAGACVEGVQGGLKTVGFPKHTSATLSMTATAREAALQAIERQKRLAIHCHPSSILLQARASG